MTKIQTHDLLAKVEMLEAKAAILMDEAVGIRKILQDILDPENKKAQKEAHMQLQIQRALAHRARVMNGTYFKNGKPPGRKPGTDRKPKNE